MNKYLFIVLVSLLFMSSISGLRNLRNYSFLNMEITKRDKKIVNDEKVLLQLIEHLEKSGIKYVYSSNEFLQYQINFLTEHRILTISRKDRCRTPEHIPFVMAAQKKNKSELALVGYNFRYAYTNKIPLIQNKIFYIISPDKRLLKQVGFFN